MKTPTLTCSFFDEEIGPLTHAVLDRYDIRLLHWHYNPDLDSPSINILTDPRELMAYANVLSERVSRNPTGWHVLDVETKGMPDVFFAISLFLMRRAAPNGKHTLYNMPNFNYRGFPMDALDFYLPSVYIGSFTKKRLPYVTEMVAFAHRLDKEAHLCTWHRQQIEKQGEGHGEFLTPAQTLEQHAMASATGCDGETTWAKGEATGTNRFPDGWGDAEYAKYLEAKAQAHGLVAVGDADAGGGSGDE